MSALFDEDPAVEVERIAAEWATYQKAVNTAIHDVREHLLAIATARLLVDDDGPATLACDRYMEQISPEMLIDMLQQVLWYGAVPVEREARARLLALRDTNTVHAMQEHLGTPGGTQ